MNWVCAQLGSREHYAIPAALEGVGILDHLLTDVWISETSAAWLRPWLPGLASRRASSIPDHKVKAWTFQRLYCDARRKIERSSEWTAIMKRNEAFGLWAAKRVSKSNRAVLFSYSYTALQPFQHFRGLKVLGQIDPGPREQEVVAEAAKSYEKLALPESSPPAAYWELWREEVALADKIVVNSAWSASLLAEAGVPEAKMVEIPLVYERVEPAVASSQSSARDHLVTRHPSPVTGAPRRLRALFLGSVILRKGVGQLFDAILQLKNEPVDFVFAGPVGVKIPDDIRALPQVTFLGPVDRSTAERLYRESDVFLFPTLSDGFGLTQLEALGHGLPIIASTNCGQVVEHGVSGLVLDEVTSESITEAIMQLVRDPDLLAKLKASARVPDKFHPRHLAPALLALEGKL